MRFKQFMEIDATTMSDTDKVYDSDPLNRELGIDPSKGAEIGTIITALKPLPMMGGQISSGPISLKVINKTEGPNCKYQLQVVDDMINPQKIINKAKGVSKLPYTPKPFWISKKDFDMIDLLPLGKANANPMGGGAGGGLGL